jgi:hypothetical protein
MEAHGIPMRHDAADVIMANAGPPEGTEAK